MKFTQRLFYTLIFTIALMVWVPNSFSAAFNSKVRLITSQGDIDIELFVNESPKSVKNFLKYVDEGFYDGTIFHRVIPNFMVQGGGFEESMIKKNTDLPIRNEANNGLKNLIGTVAMARTSDPNSATAQFFINTADNPFLNFKSVSANGWGYSVFGKVVNGYDIVKKIEKIPTQRVGAYDNVPIDDVLIIKAKRL